MVTYTKISPKVVNPIDLARNTEEEEITDMTPLAERGVMPGSPSLEAVAIALSIPVSVANISNSQLLPVRIEQKMAEFWFENPNDNGFS